MIIGVLVILFGIGDFYLEKNNIQNSNINFTGQVVTATVDSIQKSSSGRTLQIKNIKVNNESINSNCYLYLNNDEVLVEICAGDKITFVAERTEIINSYSAENPSVNYIKNNIKYKLTTSEVVTCGKDESLKLVLQQKIKENILLGLDNEKTNLMFSSLFGDKTDLNPMIKTSFNVSGVAHLLAVSGLHVGLIVVVLMAILKMFKCNKYVSFVVVIIFLIFYCYLCGWSTSIVRATIMSAVLLGAPLVLSEYDALSSISLAAIIILLISPSALFDISFLLSFMCVLGITMFYPYAKKLSNKLHLDNPIAQIFSISVITNISTLFVMIYFFKELSLTSIVANIFILPLFTFLFSIVFILSLLSIIMPFVCYLLKIIEPLINIIILFSNFFASISISMVSVNISFLSVIIFAVLLLFISKYNLKNSFSKLVSINIVLVLLILQILLNLKVIGL